MGRQAAMRPLTAAARAGSEKEESGGDSQAGRIMIHPAGPARFDREIGIAFAKHDQRRAVRRVPVCLTPVGHEVEPRRPFVIVDLPIVNAVIAHAGRAFRASATLHSQH